MTAKKMTASIEEIIRCFDAVKVDERKDKEITFLSPRPRSLNWVTIRKVSLGFASNFRSDFPHILLTGGYQNKAILQFPTKKAH